MTEQPEIMSLTDFMEMLRGKVDKSKASTDRAVEVKRRLMAKGWTEEHICAFCHASELVVNFGESLHKILENVSHMAKEHDYLDHARAAAALATATLTSFRIMEHAAHQCDGMWLHENPQIDQARHAMETNEKRALEILAACEAKHKLLIETATNADPTP